MALIGQIYQRKFVYHIHFIGLENVSLGVTFNWLMPNMEIHLPFCFIRIGWQAIYKAGPQPFYTWGKTYPKS